MYQKEQIPINMQVRCRSKVCMLNSIGTCFAWKVAAVLLSCFTDKRVSPMATCVDKWLPTAATNRALHHKQSDYVVGF